MTSLTFLSQIFIKSNVSYFQIIGTLTTYFIIIITFNGEWGQEGLSGWDFSPSGYASND